MIRTKAAQDARLSIPAAERKRLGLRAKPCGNMPSLSRFLEACRRPSEARPRSTYRAFKRNERRGWFAKRAKVARLALRMTRSEFDRAPMRVKFKVPK